MLLNVCFCFCFSFSYRKPDCDIRIQLPQVSKEHCRIDLNENKEVMQHLFNMTSLQCFNQKDSGTLDIFDHVIVNVADIQVLAAFHTMFVIIILSLTGYSDKFELSESNPCQRRGSAAV